MRFSLIILRDIAFERNELEYANFIDSIILDMTKEISILNHSLKNENLDTILKKYSLHDKINIMFYVRPEFYDIKYDSYEILNDAINILKNYNPSDIDILTKVHSIKEAVAKIEYFRKHKVENNIIIVPDEVQKSQMVNASGNILVDDSDRNLVDWENNNGIVFSFGEKESKFIKISSLDDVLNPDKVKRLMKN